MAINSLDIRRTEFTRRLRGFDADEVGAYLELLAREFEGLQHETQAAQDRIRELENRIQHYERIELALEEALRTTRESSRQAVESAHQKADEIRAQASREAERVTHQAEQEHTRLRQEAQAIAVRRKEIVARLRAFLMSEMEVLAHFDGEDPVGFIKLMPQAEALLSRRESEPRADQTLAEHSAPRTPEPVAAAAPEAPPPAAATPEVQLPEAPPLSGGADEPTFEDTTLADVPYWGQAAPGADYPTPSPEPAAEAFTPSPEPAMSWNEAVYPPEIEAYFQNLPAPEGEAEETEDTFTQEPPAVAPAYGLDQEGFYDAPDVHAPEPGEVPVPEAPQAPEPVAAAWAAPERAYEYDAPEAQPHDSESEPEFEAAPEPVSETPVPDPFITPQAQGAPAFEVRSVHRERFRIETLVGPSMPPAPQPDADVSEESAHIRRLLDSLD